MTTIHDIPVLVDQSIVDVKHTDLSKEEIIDLCVDYLTSLIDDYYDKHGKKYEPFLVIRENLYEDKENTEPFVFYALFDLYKRKETTEAYETKIPVNPKEPTYVVHLVDELFDKEETYPIYCGEIRLMLTYDGWQ